MSRNSVGLYAAIASVHAAVNTVNKNVRIVASNIDDVNSNVEVVNDNVKIIFDEIGTLARDFHDFVVQDRLDKRLALAHTKIIQIRQELEKKYGHYDVVRRHATGILQADDLGLVKKSTITTATEELMISTPGYWLAPCLVALAAWINDERELAEKALKEGIRRNDEKTSLFFALICRRAERQEASLKWLQRYLAGQDVESLDRKCIIVLDAYASGLIGNDSEGVIARQIGEWMDHLIEKPGFIEQQAQQWSDAFELKRKPYGGNYTYLRQYSHTWPVLEDIMEGAELHATVLDYFTGIFEQQPSTASVKAQLDEILDTLVGDFDDEELPLRRAEKLEQFVIDFNGNEDRAQRHMAIEESAFETHKDFSQLLTDAAMKPESTGSSVASQKLAIALSREWILNAYNDVTAKNRMKIPNEIGVNVDTFNGVTTDGRNEQELIQSFNVLIDKEKATASEQYQLTVFDKFCLFGGIAIALVGLLMMGFSHLLFGIAVAIAGGGLVLRYIARRKQVNTALQAISEQFEQKRSDGQVIIRALLAEVVDFRSEFAEKDAQSQKVIDFLGGINPDQYVRKLAESSRRIKI